MPSDVSFPGDRAQGYAHGFAFDPTHAYTPNRLLGIEPPPVPEGFAEFWEDFHADVVEKDPDPQVRPSPLDFANFSVHEVAFRAHDGLPLHGWLTLPKHHPIRRAFLVGHGYGGREEPDPWLPAPDAAGFFPCARGIGRSAHESLPSNPQEHILVGIRERSRYILGPCAADCWTAATVLERLVPESTQRLDFLGTSFAGGVGMLALPWEPRFHSAHLRVPSFGHYPLRLQLPCVGSGRAVAAHVREHPEAIELLRFFDAAVAAGFSRNPLHVAPALFDPAVPPAGQFAIYNAHPGPKELFILHAGHFSHPEMLEDSRALRDALSRFFAF